MKNKKGFISMALVYTFLIVFMLLMLAVLRAYTEKDKFLTTISEKINDDLSSSHGAKNMLINRVIDDNGVLNDRSVYYYKVANNTHGNGNGLLYMNDETKTDENNDSKYSRIYFFRGSVTTNHVVFANTCFRIVRFNEDGGARLVYNGPYNGTSCPNIGTGNRSIGTAKFRNESSSSYIELVDDSTPLADEENVQSPIIRILNEWYERTFVKLKANGVDYYTDDINKSAIYCNNRSYTYDSTISANRYRAKELIAQFIDNNNHSIYNDANIKNNIDIKCNNAPDRLTAIDKMLLYPIGLLTAQDVVLAGGYYNDSIDNYAGGVTGVTNNEYYLYTGANYWTMSPADSINVVYVDQYGTLRSSAPTAEYKIVPVISLNASAKVDSGNGTSTNPYIIK